MVAIQEIAQPSLFPDDIPDARSLTEKFLSIVRATTEDPENELPKIVPDAGYRNAFLRLSRNLAPNGKAFESMEIRSLDDPTPVTLSSETRVSITNIIREEQMRLRPPRELKNTITLEGVLRALDLDRDWLEVTVVGDGNTKVHGVNEAVDDVIGPMVNHAVKVKAFLRNRKYQFIDIESDE